MDLNTEQRKWLDGLKRHLKKMPDGIELLFGDGMVDAHPVGWWKANIYDTDADMPHAGEAIEAASLYRIEYDRRRIRPNSESI